MARVSQADWTFTIVGADLNTFRVITKTVRQNTKITGMAKRRARYAFMSVGTCSLCLLPLCFNLGEGEPARGEFGHTVALCAWGTSQPINYSGQHSACNAAAAQAGCYDLREWVAPGNAWPSETETIRWERTPNNYVIKSGPLTRTRTGWKGLPTVEQMAEARAERGMPF